MSHSVEQSRGHFLVAKYLHPFTEIKLGGKHDGGFLV